MRLEHGVLLKKVHVRESCPAGALAVPGPGWAGQPVGAGLKEGEFVPREVRRSDLGKRFLLKTPAILPTVRLFAAWQAHALQGQVEDMEDFSPVSQKVFGEK